jgi:hypothetical protein
MSKRAGAPQRHTVDLSSYPDLVVIYLGMYVKSPRGMKTLAGFIGPIRKSVEAGPDGLLLHEFFAWSLLPPHAGIRQYWRDFDSLERWARSGMHKGWWEGFLRNPAGTAFWHEAYSMRGGIDCVFDNFDAPAGGGLRRALATGPRQGLYAFAPLKPARGGMFSSRGRLGVGGESSTPPVYAEKELYE